MNIPESVKRKTLEIYAANLVMVFLAIGVDTIIQPAMLENLEHLSASSRWLLDNVLNHTGLVGNGFFMALAPAVATSIAEYALKKNAAPEAMRTAAKYITGVVMGLAAVGVGLILYDAKVSQEIVPHIVKVAKDSADVLPGYYGIIMGLWTALLLRNKVFLADGDSTEEKTPASS